MDVNSYSSWLELSIFNNSQNNASTLFLNWNVYSLNNIYACYLSQVLQMATDGKKKVLLIYLSINCQA